MGKGGGCCCGEDTDLGVDPLVLLGLALKARGFIQGRRTRREMEEAMEMERQMLEAQRVEAERKAAAQKKFIFIGGSLLLIGAIGYARMQEND
jgi:hypothetical protein